jgi:2-methylisocitrate lyase-like PEP mutase family enzyme
MANHRQQLKQRLARGKLIQAPGFYDGLSALLAEQAGFDCSFLSGGSLSFARFGRPDMGLVCASEVVDTIHILRDRVALPLIVDMDTGFGNALNVQRTVRDFERAGASALQMEDQVLPKRCGHMAGKAVVSAKEMVGKIHAALDARQDRNTQLLARTDALGVLGFDEAMDRARQYVEAGADILFIEAPKSIEQMQLIGREFGNHIPLVHNLVEGGSSPTDSVEELQAMAYRIALYPVALLHRVIPQAQALLKAIIDHGNTATLRPEMFELNDTNQLLGAPELLDAGKRYGQDH